MIALQTRQSLWRYRWRGLMLAAALSFVGCALLVALPDRYRASAQLYVNTNSSIERFRESVAADAVSFTAADLVAKSFLDRERLREVEAALSDIEIASAARWDKLFRISHTAADRRRAVAAVESFVAVIAGEAAGNEAQPGGDGEGGAAPPFRLIEAPNAVEVVRPPQRQLWIAAVLMLSLAAGAAFAVRLNSRDPVFDTAEELAAAVDVPVLGVITHARLADAQGALRRESWAFGVTLGIFLLAAAVIVVGLRG